MQNKKATWILLFIIICTNYTAAGKVWPLKAIVNGQNHQRFNAIWKELLRTGDVALETLIYDILLRLDPLWWML